MIQLYDKIYAAELIERALEVDSRGDFQKSFRLYLEAAELGSVFAMNEVGSMYLNGTGVEQNPCEGFNWIKRAAELKNPVSMAMLARMYELGVGVEQDISAALKWYVEAANVGEEHARQRLEMLFNEGR